MAWGDCCGGLGVIRFSVNPAHTRICSLVQTIEDIKLAQRKFLFSDLANQLVDNVFARHLRNIHPLEVKQASSSSTQIKWKKSARRDANTACWP